MKFTDDEGMPLRLVPDTLEVPPALEAIAKKLLEKDKLEDGGPNPYKGTAKVNPGLTSDTAWFLHVTSKKVKSFIVQKSGGNNQGSSVGNIERCCFGSK